ncbi:CHK domain-containing protein [Meloidogyne graminicola]|uniref:CHK domain-containing protein n=1 Tax=Meloidogyne graminicola TaxID=189291 RepID=A0A8T0A3A3_9BILA|nr:CHK domain-containing protein [Meloidogyne graminicola]
MLKPHLSTHTTTPPTINYQNLISNQQQQNKKQNQIINCSRSPQPSILSANSDFVSPLPIEEQDEEPPIRQWICGTQVSFEWLFQRLIEKFKCPNELEPQWIVERLNDTNEKDLDRTNVLKITFNWVNQKLPKSVILKISEANEEDSPGQSKLGFDLFKRECQIYEWLSKNKNIAIPRIFVIKKKWSKSCSALIVMEDLSDKASTGQISEGISSEGIRSLLRILAQFHALSMMKKDEWNKIIGNTAELPQYFYIKIKQFVNKFLKKKKGENKRKYKLLQMLIKNNNLQHYITRNGLQFNIPECLVHGNPVASNIFFYYKNKQSNNLNNNENMENKILLIDWTQTHCGCLGEDLAKCICWNMSKKERNEAQLIKLLQYYHYQLLKKLQLFGADANFQKEITFDRVTDAFEHYIPLAALTFLLFLPEDLNNANSIVLEKANQLLEEAELMIGAF